MHIGVQESIKDTAELPRMQQNRESIGVTRAVAEFLDGEFPESPCSFVPFMQMLRSLFRFPRCKQLEQCILGQVARLADFLST